GRGLQRGVQPRRQARPYGERGQDSAGLGRHGGAGEGTSRAGEVPGGAGPAAAGDEGNGGGDERKGRGGRYPPASTPPAPPRPGARSARRERCLSIVSQTNRAKESPMWFKNFVKSLTSTSTRRRPARRPMSRLCLEALEDRSVPSCMVSLAPSEAAPQLVGERITWTATAADCGAAPVYQF